MHPQHIKLSDSIPQVIRMLSSVVATPLAPGQKTWVTVTRTGTFTDPRYGTFEITNDMLLSMVRNFDARTVGIDIFIDVSHKPDDGAAAKITKLSVEGNRLRALVEWTAFGVSAIKERGFRYLSAEYHENYQDNEVGETHGAVLLGAGLTVRPVIKRLDPVTLSCESEDGNIPLIVHPELAQRFLTEANNSMTILTKLLTALAAMSLSEPVRAQFKTLAETQLKGVTDESVAKSLAGNIEAAAKALAEETKPLAGLAAAVVDKAPESAAPVTLSEAQIGELVTKKLNEARKTADDIVAAVAAKKIVLSETINAAEGLDDELKKELSTSASHFITADMSDDKVRELAQHQIEHGNRVVAAKTLSSMGYGAAPAGSPHIMVLSDDSKKLTSIYTDHLKKTSSAHMLSLDDKAPLHPFCERILAEYDRIHGADLQKEIKVLAGAATDMASTNLPYSVQREVIRQALSDLNVLALVQTLTDFNAQATTQIPFETRDMSQMINDGMVFEARPIPFAGVSQGMESVWVTPMKIALSITNEVMFFTRSSALNWDALGRNIETNARIMKELVHRRICNELQRASDSYLAATVSNEAFTTQLTGAKSVIKTTGFPVVRPFQPRDLQGNAQGVAENAITVVLNSVTVLPYDGSGTQTTGTYYRVVSYNVGTLQFVNQAGVPVTPANTGTNTISYSRATNVALWNSDFNAASITLEKNLNGLLRAIGARKAMMKAQRFVEPDYLLMSPTLNDTISNAEQFVVSLKRDGTNTSSVGDLDAVKSIPTFGTNAPGIDLGDERILMGKRGVTGYTIVKPYVSGELIEAIDPTTGKPLGKKVAYGEEYNAIATPKAVRDRATSIVVFSQTARDAI
ncbi:hypothetical protein DTO96_102517 [Ephemeroptericola cinctiostellae]|uniref:Uncharacterized protein n=1 Tax=Ephemeroptericola cinctiostellae TaxID=2268024 RepID=A0A345DEH3_9BURK|nr:phage protease [Ephemeroptericola cinctiostellae]AXF86761.1 hypothetical protein DTO96_102517 [Ephemeroptericola cinctiostellae]